MRLGAPRRRSWQALGARLGTLAAMLAGAPAHAHGAGHTLSWTLDPIVLLPLAFVSALYGAGVWRKWRRAGQTTGLDALRAGSFAAGLVTLVLALVSPLHDLSRQLFAAHMVQHILLILVAAPLLAYGAPLLTLLWALPDKQRAAAGRLWHRGGVARSAAGFAGQPLVTWCMFTAALWIWHLPGPYQAAVANPLIHHLEHATFLAAAMLSWWAVLRPLGRTTSDYAVGVLLVFATKVQAGTLAALITFAAQPMYPIYASTVDQWGLTLMEDQALGGLIMGTPMGLIYLFTGAALFLLWLARMEKRAPGAAEGRG